LAQFYKELKELRQSQDISLEDISSRTKINIQYLRSIENGDFNKIETPYLRLFLRAYAEEIGGDSTRSLEQLDSFMGTARPVVRNSNNLEDEKRVEINLKDQIPSFFYLLDQKRRTEIIKGGFFSIIFIFAIIISQKIFNQESHAIITKDGPVFQITSAPITDKILLKNFVVDQTITELLNIDPPFFIKIKTLEQISYSFKKDRDQYVSKLLNANMAVDFETFISSAELIISSTESLNIYINGFEVEKISNYNNPIKLTFIPSPPSIEIQKYKPLP